MDSRERFLETLRYGSPDRVPCFEEGIREEVPFAAYADSRELLDRVIRAA
jgi:hypothetical protein